MKMPGAEWLRKCGLAAVVGLAAGFLFCGYEFIRSPSSSLFIENYGAKNLSYAMLAGALLTIAMLYAYGYFLSALGARRALFFSAMFSAASIAALLWAARLNFKPAAVLLYALREAYIVMLVEQYWSFINSVFTESDARRFNGFICGIGSLGAIAGGFATGWLAGGKLGFVVETEDVVLLASVCLVPAALLTELGYRLGGEPKPSVEEKTLNRKLALSLFAGSSYLRRMLLLIFLTQVISTALDLRFFGLVEEAFPGKDARTAFTGVFYGKLNLVAGILQFVVVPLLLPLVSLRAIHLFIPVVHAAAAILLIAKPTLATGGFAFMTFKALDYSLFRAAKEIFYIPLSFDGRYKAKEVIDAFGYRAAKGMAGGMASFLTATVRNISASIYPAAVVVCSAAWFLIIPGMTREYFSARDKKQGLCDDQTRR